MPKLHSEALCYSEELGQLLNQVAIIAITDLSGTLIEVNENFCVISGYSRKELIGNNHRIVSSGLHSKEFFSNLWKKILAGEIWRGEIRNKRKDGSYYWVDTVIIPKKNKKGVVSEFVSFRYDITEHKALEPEAIQSARLAAVGEFATGIAHEINNPLAIIAGFANQAKKEICKVPFNFDRSLELINLIDHSCFRISKIIRNLIAFVGDFDTTHIESATCKEIIEETVTFFSARFKQSEIQFWIEMSSKQDFSVSCCVNLIQQVVLSLLINASEAVENQNEKWISLRVQNRDGKVRIEISDSGPGIPYENHQKIFEPFFSTKAEIKGRGLGLSFSRGVIERHGGKLYLDFSRQNTTFVIELPECA